MFPIKIAICGYPLFLDKPILVMVLFYGNPLERPSEHSVRTFGGSMVQLPSGNLTKLLNITIFTGKIHYFYGHFQ